MLVLIGRVDNMQNYIIKTWLIRLKGAKHDLDELPSVFNFPFATVIRLGATYYLTSTELNKIKDANYVYEASAHIIEMVMLRQYIRSTGFSESIGSIFGSHL